MNDYHAPNDLLEQKVILITGAGDGIGKQAALTYAAHGATCILLGKTVSKLEAVYDEIVANGDAEPAIVPLDLQGATPDHYKGMADTITDQFGKLDGVLLNSGALHHFSRFVDISPEECQKVMQVHPHSSVYFLQALHPVLAKTGNASVVLTCSTVARHDPAVP